MKGITTFRLELPVLLFSLMVWFDITLGMEYQRNGTADGISAFFHGLQNTGFGWMIYHLALALAGGKLFKRITRNFTLKQQLAAVVLIAPVVCSVPYFLKYFMTPGQ